MPHRAISRKTAFCFLIYLVFAWGANWSITKAILEEVSPLWAAVFCMVPSCLLIWILCLATGRLSLPPRSDLPIVFSVGLLHMGAFTLLTRIGLLYLPAGRSVILAYTTPLWVLPAARIFLRERFTARSILGLLLGLGGMLVLFQPASFDWTERNIVVGHGLILLAALGWAICIVHMRGHRWTSTTLRLLPWQTLVASTVFLAAALAKEGIPDIRWSWKLVGLMTYTVVAATVIAYWVMNTVNRALPASVTSMALLGVPLVGLLISTILLKEPVDTALVMAGVMITTGVALGTWKGGRVQEPPPKPSP